MKHSDNAIDINKEDNAQNNESIEVSLKNFDKNKGKDQELKDKGKKPEAEGLDEDLEEIERIKKEDILKRYVGISRENERIKKLLKDKEKEVSGYLDKYRRTLADMENLRKRTVIEKQNFLKYANFNIISDLLVILDDFQRAIDSARSDKKMDLKHFVDGVEMIEKQFVDLLFKKYGVVKYCEKGEDFNPQIHLAMTAEEGDFKKETVLDIFRKGYSLHDRVIRAAQVKVGKPKE